VIEGALVNNHTLSISAGVTLQVTGSYTQASGASFKPYISSESQFGAMSVGGAATIAGTLTLVPLASFKASLGQTYQILKAASLAGKFAVETGDRINSAGLYYKPTYSASAVTLLVSQATLSLSAKSGLPGSAMTLKGSGYLPGDTITPIFIDHGGVQTTLPSVTTNESGEYTAEITIPESAALGGGTIKTLSTQTGLQLSASFKVT
jgi:hypothetical protein